MKNTLSEIRQLFNVKELCPASRKISAIPDNTMGIIDTTTNQTVLPANFAALPDNFKLFSKCNGKNYKSFDVINKNHLYNLVQEPYKAPIKNEWQATLSNCNCTEQVKLVLNVDEALLENRDGLTWTHKDFIIELAPEELKCLCDCTGKEVYENHLFTKILYDKINANNSPFYEAAVKVEGGDEFASASEIQTFIDSKKSINTDSNLTNDSDKLTLIIRGKELPQNEYHTIEANYLYPRGVKLTPVLILNKNKTVNFTETSQLGYELGLGYDLKDEEFKNMNSYTTLNYNMTLSDGLPSQKIHYQFEDREHYNTISFEFGVPKTLPGEEKRFSVLLGTSVTTVFTRLKSIFGL